MENNYPFDWSEEMREVLREQGRRIAVVKSPEILDGSAVSYGTQNSFNTELLSSPILESPVVTPRKYNIPPIIFTTDIKPAKEPLMAKTVTADDKAYPAYLIEIKKILGKTLCTMIDKNPEAPINRGLILQKVGINVPEEEKDIYDYLVKNKKW